MKPTGYDGETNDGETSLVAPFNQNDAERAHDTVALSPGIGVDMTNHAGLRYGD